VPQRFLFTVGIPLGLLIILFAPAWTGWDEHAHFLRATDIASGSLFPETAVTVLQDISVSESPSRIKADSTYRGTEVPAKYVEDSDIVIRNWLLGNPAWTGSSLSTLLSSDLDGRTTFVDLRATQAAPPVAYLPSALGMALPVLLDTPAVVALLGGRLGNMIAYLLIAGIAIRLAVAFRWTLVAMALLPMHLALGATISPDAVTVAALFLVFAFWTRIRGNDSYSLWGLATAVLLLALAKPPYFLILGLLPISGFRSRTNTGYFAGGIGIGGIGLGILITLLNSSTRYQAASSTMIDDALFLQPDVQRSRLLQDPFGFLWATCETWFTEFDDYVNAWFRSFGFFPSDLPQILPWIFLLTLCAASLRLDGIHLKDLHGIERCIFSFGSLGMIILLYASSYLYFTDHLEYDTIGLQMARYSAPLLLFILLAGSPRWALRRLRTVPDRWAHITLALIPTLSVGAVLITWLATGTVDRY